MKARRGVQILVCLFATFTIAIAQPKKAPAPKKDTKAGSGSAAGSAAPAAGSGSGSGSGSAAPADEGPPPDMEGKDENPGRPHGATVDEEKIEVKVPEKKVTKSGYPIEEAARPITLPANMAEVAIGPHAQFKVPNNVGYAGSDALHARYGITRQVQLGFTYVLGGIYDDPKTAEGGAMNDGAFKDVGIHPGKAIGLDVTYLIRNFIGVKVGVPVWIYKPDMGGSAPAIGLTIGAPIKFSFGDKFALGGLDDLLAIKLSKFAPSFEYEYLNAYRAAAGDIGTRGSNGFLRFSGYGIYQRSPKLALIGRVGITFEDFSSEKTNRGGGSTTFLRAGLEYTVRKYLDVGFSLGWDDLSALGTFGPGTLLAFRI
jgi:hypothetical protein